MTFGGDGRVRPELLAGHTRYFVGLDLGKAQDHTAVAVIERAELVWREERDPVTWQPRRGTRHFLRHLRRVPLQTPYPDVVELLRDLVSGPALAKRSTLVVDATGVGAPVVDLLRRAALPCSIVPVMITGGDAESRDGDVVRAPKRDLIVGLQVAMQKRWLEVAGRLAMAPEFVKELLALRMRVSVTGSERFGGRGHDDLVMAVALAWWRARRSWPGIGERGEGRIV
jgi:hypothetical protein